MEDYLIPANTNRGKLILGFFRPIDLFIFSGGVISTFILVLILQNMMDNVVVAIIVLLPALVCGFLVLPFPHQHNMLVVITNAYNFYFVNRQRYIWKGWCNDYGESETSGK